MCKTQRKQVWLGDSTAQDQELPSTSRMCELAAALQALIEDFELRLTEYAAERAEEERTEEAARQHAERRRGEQGNCAYGEGMVRDGQTLMEVPALVSTGWRGR